MSENRASRVMRLRRSQRFRLCCEPLEQRQLLAAAGTESSLGLITASPNLDVMAAVSTGPTGLTPEQIQAASGINLVAFSGGTITGNGAGETIAIVDAYKDSNIASDLAAFDATYGISAPPSFLVKNLGATTTDAGWALETALDVEWAHAIAPAANIILVEAASSSLSSLFSAVKFASEQPGVDVVSMSWGTDEFRGESSYDSLFTTPAGHNNVAYVAASGDAGAWSGPEYPSVSPNVLAVGGTTLNLSPAARYGAESGWSGSTGGFSGLDSNFRSSEPEPAYQTSTLESAGLSFGARTTPDVSFNADPNSGVSVYDSTPYDGQSGWFQIGGTSAAAPAWAGLIAITDQGLATGGKGPLSSTQVLTDLYSLPNSDFNDVTSGFNGYSATSGYDLVSGLGSPKSQQLIAGLLAANGVSEGPVTSNTVSATGTAAATSTAPVSAAHHHVRHARHVEMHRADLSSTSTGGSSTESGSTTASGTTNDGATGATTTTGVTAVTAPSGLSPSLSIPAPAIEITQAQTSTSSPATTTAASAGGVVAPLPR